MKLIDLTIELSNDLPVFPGDDPVSIDKVQSFEKDQWNMRRLHINGHDGTHINAQIHGMKEGRSLDDYKIEDFVGESILFESIEDIQQGIGLVVANQNIDMELAKIIVDRRPKFVALGNFEMDIGVEKFFFENNILCYERLTNTDKLPKRFVFHGVPLKIKEGDGSPVRAYVIID